MTEKLFILLRLGLDLTVVEDEDIDTFRNLQENEWESIRSLASEQGVSGVCFAGVQKVVNSLGVDGVKYTDIMSYLKWLGTTAKRNQFNDSQLTTTKRLAEALGRQDVKLMLMKGQANGLNYPNPMHREKGDIDCFLIKNGRCAYTEGNRIAKELGLSVDESWYKHSVINANGESVENHQYFVHTRDGKRGKNLDKTLREFVFVDKYETYPDSEILLPPVMFNALFLTYHALAHFVSEGMHLKQIVDWVMFIKKYGNDIDWAALRKMCDEFNLRVFLECTNLIASKYFRLTNVTALSAEYADLSERIITSIFNDKDFVFGSGEGNWHNRWHLITNLFKYRWKYEDVYETSIWKQIWYYATGFIFKTE